MQVVDLDDDGRRGRANLPERIGLSDSSHRCGDLRQSTEFSLTFNGFGTGFDYDLTVGGQTATGLSFWQNTALNNFDELTFVNEFSNTGYEIDNVVVSTVPEPSSAVLLMLSGLALSNLGWRRRR